MSREELEVFVNQPTVRDSLTQRILPSLAYDMRSLYDVYIYEGDFASRELKLIEPRLDQELAEVRRSIPLKPPPVNYLKK